MQLHIKPLIQNELQEIIVQGRYTIPKIKGQRQAKEFLKVHYLNRPGPIK